MKLFSKVRGWRLWVRRFILAVLVATIVASLAITIDGLNDDLHSADVAVVLGNKVRPDGTPSQMLKARLDHTVDLYRQGYFKLILVSGGHGKEGYDEPVFMRSYLESQGIPSASIFEDNGGYNTWCTAQDTLKFLQAHHLQSVIIVTSYFHITRSQLALKKFGIDPIYTSHSPYWSIRDFYSLPREAIGYVAYSLRKPGQTDSSTSSE